MYNIIVPIDFSYAAECALQYAYRLALFMKTAKIELFHAYKTPLVESVGSFEELELLASSVRKEKIVQLKIFVQKTFKRMHVKNQVEIEYIAAEGEIAGLLAQYTESRHLIVMGTEGQSHSETFTHGSLTSEVLLHVSVPVLVVPVGAEFTKPKSLLFAIDYENYDHSVLYSLSSFANAANASVTLLHIHPDTGYFDHKKMTNYRKTLRDILPNENMKLVFLTGENLEQSIFNYLEEKKLDLPVLLSRKGTILNNQYTDSFSRLMTMRTQTPLLIFHASEDSSLSNKP